MLMNHIMILMVSNPKDTVVTQTLVVTNSSLIDLRPIQQEENHAWYCEPS